MPASWQNANNILCVRLDSIGDVLMTTPALRALRDSRPGRQITLLTSPSGAEAARLVPEIDDIIIYDAPWVKATAPRDTSLPEYAMVNRIMAGQYDAAVVFTVYSQNPLPAAFLCYLADVPLRLAHCRENPYQLLTDWLPDPEPDATIRHEARRQLDLVAAVGCGTPDERLSLRVPDPARAMARERLQEIGLGALQPWVLVHPGATAPSRRYPPEGYAQVVQRLVAQHGLQVVFSGAANERELIKSIQDGAGVPTASLAGILDLPQLAALVDCAPLLLTNNTGPAHIAAATGTPVVDLYALTNPQHQPWQVPARVLSHDVPCKYCYKSICPEGHHNCLRLVTPDQVVQACLDLLSESMIQTPKHAEVV